MKNHSRVLSWQSLEKNIDLLKLAGEASQENFENVFLSTKYEQIVKLEHLLCPKVGGGHKPTCAPPPFESGDVRASLPPFSYALGCCVKVHC